MFRTKYTFKSVENTNVIDKVRKTIYHDYKLLVATLLAKMIFPNVFFNKVEELSTVNDTLINKYVLYTSLTIFIIQSVKLRQYLCY